MNRYLKVLILVGFTSLLFCKKLPTFLGESPKDFLSENYTLPSVKNVTYQLDGSKIVLMWNTDGFNTFDQEAFFSIELLSENDVLKVIETDGFTNSAEFTYDFEFDIVYKFRVTTILFDKTSEPATSNDLTFQTINIPMVSIFSLDSTGVLITWYVNDDINYNQEISLTNLVTGETEIYRFSSNNYNYFEKTFNNLDNNCEYEISISRVLNNSTFISSTHLLTHVSENTFAEYFSLDETEKGIHFFHSAFIPNTNYVVATNNSGSRVYVINKTTREIEKTIVTPSNHISKIIGRSDGTFYTFQNGTIYQGSIYTGTYTSYISTNNTTSEIGIFGLAGISFQYLYYLDDQTIIFNSVVDPPEDFSVSGKDYEHLCIGWMEDQFVTITGNVVDFYTFPLMELQATYTAPDSYRFFSCEFNDKLNKVYLTGSDSDTGTNFFGYLDKAENPFTNLNILNEETGFGNLFLYQQKEQILIHTYDLDGFLPAEYPFYVFDERSSTFSKTFNTYNGLNSPNYSAADDGHFLYTTENGILIEAVLGNGWILTTK